MLNWAVTFLVLALISAIFGFGGIAVVSVEFAKILFVAFLFMFAITAIISIVRSGNPHQQRRFYDTGRKS